MGEMSILLSPALIAVSQGQGCLRGTNKGVERESLCDSRSTMAPDLGFISYSAKRDPVELSAKGFCQ